MPIVTVHAITCATSSSSGAWSPVSPRRSSTPTASLQSTSRSSSRGRPRDWARAGVLAVDRPGGDLQSRRAARRSAIGSMRPIGGMVRSAHDAHAAAVRRASRASPSVPVNAERTPRRYRRRGVSRERRGSAGGGAGEAGGGGDARDLLERAVGADAVAGHAAGRADGVRGSARCARSPGRAGRASGGADRSSEPSLAIAKPLIVPLALPV